MRGMCLAIAIVCLSLPVSAAPSQSSDQGASVVDQFGCFITPPASGVPAFLYTDQATHSTTTPSGNSILQCRFKIPESLLVSIKQAIIHHGFLCNTFLGLTNDSEAITDPGGSITLRCIVH